jgi:hypothetical protein
VDGRIRARACAEAEEWDGLARRIPWATAQHAFGYGQVLAACFRYVQPVYRVYLDGDRIVAGLPLVRFRAGGPFRAVYSLVFGMYGGPLVPPDHSEDAGLLEAISDDIDSEAARFGAFEARFTVPPTAPEALNRCMQSGTRRVEILRHACPLLSLDRPLDEIVAGFHPCARRAVRRSRCQGVVVQAEADVGLVRQAYPLYRARMKRMGVTPKPWRFLQGILESGLGVAFLAQRDARTIALLVLLVSPGVAIFWTSAMDDAASASRPMNALVDAAIRWAHCKGIPLFNFGESYAGRPGLVRFKSVWGPRPAQNTVTIRTYRPWVRQAWLAVEQPVRRTYAVWDAFWHPLR